MPKTRVLALVTDAYGGRGGIAQYNRDFFGALASHADITVLARQAPDKAEIPSGIHQLSPQRSRIRYVLTAVAQAMRGEFDVVLCGHLYMAPIAWFIAWLAGARFVVQMHGIEAWPQPTRWRRAAVEAADLVLCVSRYTRSKVLDWAAIVPERVAVLPNTVGDAFTPGDRTKFRTANGLVDKRVLLTVGRIDSREQYKGHDRVIALLPDLVAAGYDVIYAIIGEGDDVPRLRGLAEQEGVTARVRFFGAVSRDELIDAYRAADLFVMPSTGEGFGIAFLEAMAAGAPALGLAIGGAVDALGDGELGVSVAETELATAIMRALAAPQADERAQFEKVRARFGRQAFQRQIEGLLGLPAMSILRA